LIYYKNKKHSYFLVLFYGIIIEKTT